MSAIDHPVHAEEPKVAVHEWGVHDGHGIVFVHGGFSSHLTWGRQVHSDLATDCRLVAYDLRGHGMSEKPLRNRRYTEARGWADELRAVIDALGLARPVLVGWSYGCRVIADYLSAYGERDVSAINFVGSNLVASKNRADDAVVHALLGLASTDLGERVDAIREVVAAFTAEPPGSAEMERAVAVASHVPPQVCAAMLSRRSAYEDLLGSLSIPVTLSHGSEDRIASIDAARYVAGLVPNGTLSVYDGVGHSPHRECAERFTRELHELAVATRT